MGLLLGISIVLAVASTASGLFVSNWSPLLLTQLQQSISTPFQNSITPLEYDKQKNCTSDLSKHPDPIEYLTYFNCGRISTDEEGRTLREFTITAEENKEIPISKMGHIMQAWTFNGTIPGPTVRVTEGEHVKITLINSADSKHSHSIHMHSIHASGMDGVDRPIPPGQSFTYDFIAQPAGVYPYHCHVDPIADHINRGLYGMMIIDPKTPKPQMTEMVMLMNGYDLDYDQEGLTTIRPAEGDSDSTSPESALEIEERIDGHNGTSPQAIANQTAENDGGDTDDDSPLLPLEGGVEDIEDDANDGNGAAGGVDDATVDVESQESVGGDEEGDPERDNEIYTVNGEAFLYMYNPIKLEVGKPYRVYLVNMLEFDLINSLHIHGTMFDYFPSGTSETPAFQNDIVTLSQGDRGILEFQYDYPGHYMFHAHQTEFTDLGWMGFFDVESSKIDQSDTGNSTGTVETPQHPHKTGDTEL